MASVDLSLSHTYTHKCKISIMIAIIIPIINFQYNHVQIKWNNGMKLKGNIRNPILIPELEQVTCLQLRVTILRYIVHVYKLVYYNIV